jgi:hypothetical protein
LGTITDADHDGLDDKLEDELAARFAPVVFHGEEETNFPVSVDWWLARTHLSVLDATTPPRQPQRVIAGPLTQAQLPGHVFPRTGGDISSVATRSREKQATFYLEDVAPPWRAGAKDNPAAWITYVHSYPNLSGGVTLQYWRAYSYNEAQALFLDVSHGGDWEGVAVHLDRSFQPQQVTFLGHTDITTKTPAEVVWEDTHPQVWSEEGGHASHSDARALRSRRYFRQETWPGGQVTGPDGARHGPGGGLLNLGEKTAPRHGQVFVQYSGLWGAPGQFYFTSGYWGPAYNETAARCPASVPAEGSGSGDQPGCFMQAWCDRLAETPLHWTSECYATRDLP